MKPPQPARLTKSTLVDDPSGPFDATVDGSRSSVADQHRGDLVHPAPDPNPALPRSRPGLSPLFNQAEPGSAPPARPESDQTQLLQWQWPEAGGRPTARTALRGDRRSSIGAALSNALDFKRHVGAVAVVLAIVAATAFVVVSSNDNRTSTAEVGEEAEQLVAGAPLTTQDSAAASDSGAGSDPLVIGSDDGPLSPADSSEDPGAQVVTDEDGQDSADTTTSAETTAAQSSTSAEAPGQEGRSSAEGSAEAASTTASNASTSANSADSATTAASTGRSITTARSERSTTAATAGPIVRPPVTRAASTPTTRSRFDGGPVPPTASTSQATTSRPTVTSRPVTTSRPAATSRPAVTTRPTVTATTTGATRTSRSVPASTTTTRPSTTTTSRPTTTSTRPSTTASIPISPPTSAETTTSTSGSSAGQVIWEDNFSTFDTSVWRLEHSTYGDGNNELQCYRPENVSVSGGKLILRAVTERYTCPNGSTRQVTSGMIRSSGVTFSPGQAIEFRVKLTPANPDDQGGLWPGVWASGWAGGGWPAGGEMDWLEVMTAENPNRAMFSVHYADSAGKHKLQNKGVIGSDYFSDSWHTVRFDYGYNGRLTWYLDGVESFEVDAANTLQGYPAPFDQAVREIKINLALGGRPGPLAAGAVGTQGATFEVDYIRILKL